MKINIYRYSERGNRFNRTFYLDICICKLYSYENWPCRNINSHLFLSFFSSNRIHDCLSKCLTQQGALDTSLSYITTYYKYLLIPNRVQPLLAFIRSTRSGPGSCSLSRIRVLAVEVSRRSRTKLSNK